MLDENPEEIISLSLGNKLYEMSNHLGNVLTVINDIKIPQSSNSVDVDCYLATIVSTADYSPFGVQLDGRTESAETYRYGFNGMEKDDELKGKGNSYDFGARLYDSRVARFLSIDKFSNKLPQNSPYSFASNSPIIAIDVNGDSTYVIIYGKGHLSAHYPGHDQKDNFKLQAETRKKEIENRPSFDKTRDEVILMEAPNTKTALDIVNKNYPSGKIAELHIYSHGSQNSVSLGGRKEGDENPDGSIVTFEEQQEDWGDLDGDGVQDTYDNREINGSTVWKINRGNFETSARVKLWGCNMGGVDISNSEVRRRNPSETRDQKSISEASIGSKIAFRLKVRVFAFTGSSEAKTKNRDGKRPVIFDGEMIRTKDRKSQKPKFTEFDTDGSVVKSPEIKP